MSRQLEKAGEDRASRRDKLLVRAINGELDNRLSDQGIVLLGLSVKIEDWECLMTLRALKDERREIAFVGSDSLANVIVKAAQMARKDKLVWREDKYR